MGGLNQLYPFLPQKRIHLNYKIHPPLGITFVLDI